MIRSSTLSLEFSTQSKKCTLEKIFQEYTQIVNIYLNYFNNSFDLPKFSNIEIKDTWLSARLQQCAGKQALEILKSKRKQEKNKRFKIYKKVYSWCIKNNRFQEFTNKKFSELNLKPKIKPFFNGLSINLDSRFWSIKNSNNSFDIWVHIQSIGDKIILNIPLKNHKHNKKFNSWKQLNSCRIIKNKKGKFFIEFIYEKENITIIKPKNELAIDVGINTLLSCSDGNQYGKDFKQLLIKLFNKKQDSHNYNKMLVEIKNYIRCNLNKINFSSFSDLILENLKNIQLNTKKRVNKTTRKMLSKWNLGLLHEAIKQKCEENSVYLHFVNPKNTSRTCPICHHIDKRNRCNTHFKCMACGYESDADLNASINILNLFHQENSDLSDIVPDSTKINFIDFH